MSLKRAEELKAEAEFWNDALRHNTFGTESATGIRIQIAKLYDAARAELASDQPFVSKPSQ